MKVRARGGSNGHGKEQGYVNDVKVKVLGRGGGGGGGNKTQQTNLMFFYDSNNNKKKHILFFYLDFILLFFFNFLKTHFSRERERVERKQKGGKRAALFFVGFFFIAFRC